MNYDIGKAFGRGYLSYCFRIVWDKRRRKEDLMSLFCFRLPSILVVGRREASVLYSVMIVFLFFEIVEKGLNIFASSATTTASFPYIIFRISSLGCRRS
jgi:hypothetical protein